MQEKNLDASNKKCKNCGGDLIFNPKTHMLMCEKCGSEFEFEIRRVLDKHPYRENISNQDTLAWAKEKKIMKCDTCGADIELYGLEFTKKCPYCESSYVCDVEQLPGLKPDVVVPFEFNKEDAVTIFKKGVASKFFVPSKFKRNLPESNILGVYVPTFCFDMDTFSSYKGVLERTKTVGSGDKRRTVHETFKISGTKNLIHRDYVIEASDNINDKQIVSILPYEMKEKNYLYDPNLVRGHSAKHYEDDLDKCYKVCVSKIDKEIEKAILSGYKYDRVVSLNVNTDYNNRHYIYRLLPVYNFMFDYNKKTYTVVMNGQTGKVGRGCPVSAFKVTLCVLLALILVGLFVFLAVSSN